MQIIKKISIISMSCFYIYVGIKHFVDPNWFINIVPPYLPWHLELVYLSGLFEIILGLLLLIPKTRKLAAYGLIALLIAIYPANIYLAFNREPQNLIGISSFAASWIRLPIQFLLIAIAYYHANLNNNN